MDAFQYGQAQSGQPEQRMAKRKQLLQFQHCYLFSTHYYIKSTFLKTPFSVTYAVTRDAGVTSNAGL